MEKNAKAAAPPPKRGKCMTLPQIEIVGAAYKKVKGDDPRLSAIGFSLLSLPPPIEPTSGKKALTMLREEKLPTEIDRAFKSPRSWSDPKKEMTQKRRTTAPPAHRADSSWISSGAAGRLPGKFPGRATFDPSGVWSRL